MIFQYLYNPKPLITLEFNFSFGFWEQLVLNANKDIENYVYSLLGSIFKVIPVSVVESIFKYANIFSR